MDLSLDVEYDDTSALADYIRCVLCLGVAGTPMAPQHKAPDSRCPALMCRTCYVDPVWWTGNCPACMQPCAAPLPTHPVDRPAEAIVRDLFGVHCLHCPWTGANMDVGAIHAAGCIPRTIAMLRRTHPMARQCTSRGGACGPHACRWDQVVTQQLLPSGDPAALAYVREWMEKLQSADPFYYTHGPFVRLIGGVPELRREWLASVSQPRPLFHIFERVIPRQKTLAAEVLERLDQVVGQLLIGDGRGVASVHEVPGYILRQLPHLPEACQKAMCTTTTRPPTGITLLFFVLWRDGHARVSDWPNDSVELMIQNLCHSNVDPWLVARALHYATLTLSGHPHGATMLAKLGAVWTNHCKAYDMWPLPKRNDNTYNFHMAVASVVTATADQMMSALLGMPVDGRLPQLVLVAIGRFGTSKPLLEAAAECAARYIGVHGVNWPMPPRLALLIPLAGLEKGIGDVLHEVRSDVGKCLDVMNFPDVPWEPSVFAIMILGLRLGLAPVDTCVWPWDILHAKLVTVPSDRDIWSPHVPDTTEMEWLGIKLSVIWAPRVAVQSRGDALWEGWTGQQRRHDVARRTRPPRVPSGSGSAGHIRPRVDGPSHIPHCHAGWSHCAPAGCGP